jgi:hypothetical protein
LPAIVTSNGYSDNLRYLPQSARQRQIQSVESVAPDQPDQLDQSEQPGDLTARNSNSELTGDRSNMTSNLANAANVVDFKRTTPNAAHMPNLSNVTNRHGVRAAELSDPTDVTNTAAIATMPRNRCDWGCAIDTSIFYGRTEELATLRNWLIDDRCRWWACWGLVALAKLPLRSN